MPRDPRYDILFEPVQIGPKTARNRFYQVPHCSGMGYQFPNSEAAMRGVKAEGGWAVISTQECEIHPTGDISPGVEARLWNDEDLPALAKMVDAVHEHGSLAAIELVHNGPHSSGNYSRCVPVGPSSSVHTRHPQQCLAMSRRDIREFIRWHRNAALRARSIGFDLIYVYAGHDLALPMHFLSRRWNRRSDEYGGSLENRVRLFRELIEDTIDAVGDTCAVPVRFAVDELLGEDGITCDGEGREVVEMLAELPDLWDVNISNWSNDSSTSRFAPEGFQEDYVRFVKQLTSKPVVGVGRFTSPDAMVSQIRRGVLDMIGAARPSIADPFLPKKIEEGRPEDLRECIGCNICVTGSHLFTPMRCTQNPTVGEEWRRGWHPERIAPKAADETVLVVGAGPAGLECARALGQRGYEVVLAEAGRELGGRVALESRLPGLAAWGRVRDYRQYQLERMSNAQVYLDSRLDPEQILEYGFLRVVIATGSRWRRDGIGRAIRYPVAGSDAAHVLTPEDIHAGKAVRSPVVVFDDDQFYLGALLAERLRLDGHEVMLVTPASDVSHWTHNTLEQAFIQARTIELGIHCRTGVRLAGVADDSVDLACVYTGRVERLDAGTVVMVTSRDPDDSLYRELVDNDERLADSGVESVTAIGDCLAPGTIAMAVHAGHRYARTLAQESEDDDGVDFRREMRVVYED